MGDAVIVVGCGRVGSELAVRMADAGFEVAVLDKNANSFRRLPEGFIGRRVVGFGFDRDDLVEAGVERAVAVAAVTSGDNSNILTARICREKYEVPNVVARIYDPRRALIYQRLGIATVATVSWTVDQVIRRLLPEEVGPVWTDPSGEVSLADWTLPAQYCGRPIAELASGDRYRPVLVTRGGRARLVSAGLIGQEGDVVHFAVRQDCIQELRGMLHGSTAATETPGRGRAYSERADARRPEEGPDQMGQLV